MAVLEGGAAALAVASGAAALSYSFQNIACNGDHIVSAGNIYGGTYNLLANTLPQYGISTTFVDISDFDAVERAIKDETKLLFAETLGNPHSDVTDIRTLADIAHSHGIPLIIDNTFATPYLVRPFEYGADIVIHSATKFIGGHGTSLGGVIVDGGSFDWDIPGKFPTLSEPDPGYHGIRFTEAAGSAGLRHQGPGCTAERYRSGDLSLPRVHVPARAGDPVSSGRTSRIQRAGRHRFSQEPSSGRSRTPSVGIKQ